MGLPIARQLDTLLGDRGAPEVVIINGTISNVLINGLPCAVDGSKGPVHGHDKTHTDFVQPTIIATSATVLVGGKPIARKNDPCQCGSMVTSGSNNVLAG